MRIRLGFSYKTRDGRLLEWSGRRVCVCSACEEIFNSVAAFDAHIKHGEHDYSWMPRNARGYLVTSLREETELEEEEEEEDVEGAVRSASQPRRRSPSRS